MLSLDLGQKNLGWTYLDNYNCEFGLYNLDQNKHGNLIIYRCNRLVNFINEKLEQFPITIIIIEQQVRNNSVCECLLYAITSLSLSKNLEVYIFPPMLKFKAISQKYSTKNKAHKKLSIENCRKFLENFFPQQLEYFMKFKKRDDIADSCNQAIVYGILNNLIELPLEEYKEIILCS